MNLAWNSLGVAISGYTSSRIYDQTLKISGSGWKNNTPFEYHAVITPNGWLVEIVTTAGRKGEYQGTTFNMFLEVATAVNRLL